MEDHISKCIKVLADAGWVEDGQTATQLVKIPYYPRTGVGPAFSNAKLGGRLRFKNGDHRCTVGGRTVCVYTLLSGKVVNMVTFPTKHNGSVADEIERRGSLPAQPAAIEGEKRDDDA